MPTDAEILRRSLGILGEKIGREVQWRNIRKDVEARKPKYEPVRPVGTIRIVLRAITADKKGLW